jgi:signal transduction histidine kinase
MAANVSRAEPRDASGGSVSLRRPVFLLLAPLSVAAAVVAAFVGWDGGIGGRLGWICLTLVWAIAGAVLLLRPGRERLGMLAVWFALLAGVVALAAALARDRPEDDAAALVLAVAIALLPAAAMHVLLALPAGVLTGERALAAVAGYLIASGVGVFIWTERPSLPAWPVVIEVFVAAAVAVNSVASRYRLTHGAERRQMRWAALSIAAAIEIVLVGLTLHVLIGWPPQVLQLAAAATIPIPAGLLLELSKRLQGSVDRLLVHAISLAGLTALISAVYLLVVGWLGHAPTQTEQTLVVLSIVAAAIIAVLYVPASKRLASFANQLVHGSRQSPDEIVRSFGAQLSRAVPLEELLLRLAESLRSVLALEAAEIWTGSGGMLDRVASDPERESAWLRLTASDEAVVARAGVSGRAWAAVWLPELLEGRGDAVLRVAPVSHAGELFGLVVAERAAEGPPLDEDVEDLLSELARQLGLALRNLRLDSQLQASLNELRVQAEELRASRARVVAAADAERRRIERDLHDGAQQYLAGVAVNLRAARELVDLDPEKAKAILDELRGSAAQAQEAFRDLAHGIYPPLLQDRGLGEALADAARRAPVATRVEAPALRRFDPEVEAAIYFCCLEALQNAGKHAGERARATVRVWEEAGGLLFEVADNGVGITPEHGKPGAGVTNMKDRLGAIGGNLRIESSAGHGTRVIGAIPIDT